jgi:GAF domain-containing protein
MTDDQRSTPRLDGYAAASELARVVVGQLLETSDASRATVRLADAQGALQLVAEATAAGEPEMAAGPPIDPRTHETYRYLDEHRITLVQRDCRVAVPRPPDLLVRDYGVLAQIIAPVTVGHQMRGVISLHQAARTRDWSERDVAAVELARRALEAELAGVPVPADQRLHDG